MNKLPFYMTSVKALGTLHDVKLLVMATVLFLLPAFAFASNNGVYDVRDYGASGDGTTLDTRAIQSAIDKCSGNGGEVLFPPGTYLTGSLYLRSNVTVYLQRGATILGSGRLEDYTAHISQVKSLNDAFLRYSLFYADGEKNISIEGDGTINGQGHFFKVTTKKKPDRYRNRPFIIRFVKCRNVRVEGVTLRNSAMWMQQYLACDDLTVKNITVFNHANQNNDMIDIDGCNNVIVSGCRGDTDDDGIVLKSTSRYPDENITITNCIVSSHCNAIKFGTESVGGFRNINISNIVVKPSVVRDVIFGKPDGISGITIAEVDGGSLRNINISGIVMSGPQVPIFLRLGDMHRKAAGYEKGDTVGVFKDVSITDVVATDIKSVGCSIVGLPGHPVEGVSLSDIRITFAGGVKKEDVTSSPDELRAHYPESTMWGNLPAYGFFIWHAKDISFDNIQLRFAKDDSRPAIYCDDVNGLRVNGLSADISDNADGFISIANTDNVVVRDSEPLGRTENFLYLNGKVSGIDLIGNDLRLVRNLSAPMDYPGVEAAGNLTGK